MDNISVVYATKTQHSKKLAEAIGKELGVEAINITKQAPSPKAAGLLFLVGGIYAGKCNPELISYAEKLNASITGKVVLVTSSASAAHRNQGELRQLLVGKGIEVVDEITCPGASCLSNSVIRIRQKSVLSQKLQRKYRKNQQQALTEKTIRRLCRLYHKLMQ